MAPPRPVHLHAACITTVVASPFFGPPPPATGFAGAVASTITCPIEVVKTQLQSSRVGVSGGSNPFKVAREIFQADGK